MNKKKRVSYAERTKQHFHSLKRQLVNNNNKTTHTHEKIDCEDSVADAQREMRAECTIATTAIVPHVGILSEGKVDRGLKLISPRWQILYNFCRRLISADVDR